MMRFNNESEFNREFSRRCVELGAVVVPIVGHEMQGSGWPDRYVAHVRYHGWVEGKKDARQLTGAQVHRMKELERRGVPALEAKYCSDVDAVRVKRYDGTILRQLDYADWYEDPLAVLNECGRASVALERQEVERRRSEIGR